MQFIADLFSGFHNRIQMGTYNPMTGWRALTAFLSVLSAFSLATAVAQNATVPDLPVDAVAEPVVGAAQDAKEAIEADQAGELQIHPLKRPAYDFFSRPRKTTFLQASFEDNFVPDICWQTKFSPDGKFVATAMGSANAAGGVQIWDAATQKLRAFYAEPLGVRSVSFSPAGDHIAIANATRIARVRSLKTGQVTLRLAGHKQAVSSIAFSPDGKQIVTGSHDHFVRVWDATTGRLIWENNEHQLKVYFVDWSADGQHIVSGSQDGFAILWDPITGKPNQKLHPKTDIENAAFFPDGKHVVTTGWNREAVMWDISTGKEVARFSKGHKGAMLSVAVSPDGKTLATGSADKTVTFWDVESRKKLGSLEPHAGNIYGVDFSPDGKHLVSAAWDTATVLIDAKERAVLKEFSNEEVLVDEESESAEADLAIVVLDVGANRFATGLESGLVRIRDLQSRRVIHEFTAHEEAVASVRWSPDRQLLATAGYDNTVKLWETAKFRLVGKFDLPEWALSVAFHPDGQTVAAGCYDTHVYRWNLADKQQLKKLSGHTAGINHIDWSANGEFIASASADGSVKVWDAKSGDELKSLDVHSEGANKVLFHPDSQRLVAMGEDDEKLHLFNWKLDKPLLLEVAANEAFDIGLAPDGSTLVHSTANSVQLHSFETGDLISTFRPSSDSTHALAFSADSERLIAGDWKAQLSLYRAKRPTISPVASVSREYVDAENATSRFANRWFRTLASDNRIAFVGPTEIELRDSQNAQLIRKIELPAKQISDPIVDAVFDADGTHLITSHRNEVVVWDAADGTEEQRWKSKENIQHVIVSGKTARSEFFATTNPQAVVVRSLQNGRVQHRIPLGGQLQTAEFSPDGRFLATVDALDGLQIWNPGDPKKPERPNSATGVSRIAFDPASELFAACSAGGISIWKTDAFKNRLTFIRTSSEPSALQFLNSTELCYGTSSGQLIVRDLKNERTKHEYLPHENSVTSLCAIGARAVVSLDSRGYARVHAVSDKDALSLVQSWGRELQGRHCVAADYTSRIQLPSFRYSGEKPLTIEMIVQCLPNDGMTLMSDMNPEAPAGGIRLEVLNDAWRFSVSDQQAVHSATSDRKAAVRSPVHLAAMFDGKNVSLYVNGRIQKKEATTTSDFKPSGQPWGVGSIESALSGKLTALRVSESVRFTQDFLPPQTFENDEATSLLLHFAEGAGLIAHDASGHGHHAELEEIEWDFARPVVIETPVIRPETTLATKLKSPRYIAMTDDSLTVATSRTMRVFDLRTAQKNHDIIMRDQRPLAVAAKTNLIFMAGKRGFRMIDTSSGQTNWSSYARGDVNIYRAAFTHDESALITVHRFRDGRSEIRQRDIESQKVNWIHKVAAPVTAIGTALDNESEIVGLVFQREGSSAEFETIEGESGRKLASFKLHPSTNDVKQFAWSHDGMRIVFAMKRGLVQVRDAKTLELISSIQRPTPVASVGFAADRSVYVHANDGTISIWDEQTGLRNAELTASKVTTATSDPRGSAIVTVDRNGELGVFPVSGDKLTLDAPSPMYAIQNLGDGKLLTGGVFNADLALWDLGERSIIKLNDDFMQSVVDIDISRDGQTIVVATTDGAVKSFDRELGNFTHIGGHQIKDDFEEELAEDDVVDEAADEQAVKEDGKAAANAEDVAAPAEKDNNKADNIDADKKADAAVEAPVNADQAGPKADAPAVPPAKPQQTIFPFRAVAIAGNGLIAGGGDEQKLNIWGPDRHTFFVCGFKIRAVDFSPNSELVVAGGAGPRLQIYNVSTNRLVKELNQQAATNDLEFTPDGESLLVAGEDGLIRQWNVATGKVQWEYFAHKGAVRTLRLAENGTDFVSGGYDRRVYLWNTNDSNPLARLGLHRTPINDLCWLPQQNAIASVSNDRTLQILPLTNGDQNFLDIIRGWSLPKQQTAAEIASSKTLNTKSNLKFMHYHPRGHVFAAGGLGVTIYESDSLQAIKKLVLDEEISDAKFSRDGKTFATAGSVVKLWDTRNFQLVKTIPHASTRLVFSSNSRLLAMLSPDNFVRVYDVRTKEIVFEHAVKAAAASVCFSNDGRYMVTGSRTEKDSICLWSLRNKRLINRLSFTNTHNPGLLRSPLSPNQFFGSDVDGMLTIWDMRTGRLIKETPHRNVRLLSSAPNGQEILSVDSRQQLSIWKSARHNTIARLTNPATVSGQPVVAVQYSPDGEFAAAAFASGEIVFWPTSN